MLHLRKYSTVSPPNVEVILRTVFGAVDLHLSGGLQTMEGTGDSKVLQMMKSIGHA